jgi:hypothetical protein
LKREVSVALKTFLGTWLLLSVLLQLYAEYDSPTPFAAADVVLTLTLGLLMCAVFTFWPAFAVAVIHSVYRATGWGAFAGAFVIAAGVLISLSLFESLLASLLAEVFASALGGGHCGGHCGGPAAMFALLCMVLDVVGSPASLWALAKLFLVTTGAILLGSVPGVLLWAVLLARKASRHLASARAPR